MHKRRNCRFGILGVGAIALLGIVTGCGGGSTGTGAVGGSGIIAFGSDRVAGQENQILIMNPDGTGIRQISDGQGFCRDPKISRDGRQVVFNCDKSGKFEVYKVNTDGTGQTQLTNSPTGYAGQPNFNPSRTLVAYVTHPVGSNIMIMNADGSNPHAITTGTKRDSEPVFSPDGQKVVFFSERTGNNDIFVVNVNGTGLTQLTTSRFKDEFPSFSPDGKSVIFSSDRRGNGEELHIMDLATKQVRYLPVGITARRAFYSPDGSQIVFEHEDYPAVKLYKVRADGSGLTLLTDRNSLDTLPSWGMNP